MRALDEAAAARLRTELHESLDAVSFADHALVPPQRYVVAFVRRRRRRAALWATATAIAVVAIAGVVAITRNHRPSLPASPSRPQVFTVVKAGPAGEGTPAALAAGGSWLFATSWDTGQLLRIDPQTLRTTATLPVGTARNGPISVAYGAGSVWLLNFADGNLWRVDPHTMTPTLKVPLPAAPSEVAFGHSAVWVTVCCTSTTTANRQRLLRLDPTTGAITGSLTVAGDGETVALFVGLDVVVATQGGPIVMVDPKTLTIEHSFPEPCPDCGVVAGNAEGTDGLYVSSLTSLSRYDRRTGRQVATLDVIGDVSTIGAESGGVWFAQDDQLLRLDPISLAVTGRAPIGTVAHVVEFDHAIYTSTPGIIEKLGPS